MIIRGKHIMIAVIVLLLSIVNTLIYLYWDVPTPAEWKMGSNYTAAMFMIVAVECSIGPIMLMIYILQNWYKWWDYEFKIHKSW